MDIREKIRSVVSSALKRDVIKIEAAGSGASGSVYYASLDGEPFEAAVKYSEHPDLLRQEYNMLMFLSEHADCKVPKPYFIKQEADYAVMAMEFIHGVSGKDFKLLLRPHRKRLANDIVDNLIKIHSVHNDKFGPYDNAVYDTWQEYYFEFSTEIYNFSEKSFSESRLDAKVWKAVELSYKNFDKIFENTKGVPTLIHGDYWMPNFIVDPKSMTLTGVVDPFNVMWAEPEYELFSLTVGAGRNLHLYEIYKSRADVSEFCDLKLELYALYSELLWYKKLGAISHNYLKMRSKRLMNQMKKHGII